MTHKVSKIESGHDWQKENLVTTKGGFDKLRCSYCGVYGKAYNFFEVEVPETFSKSKAMFCKNIPVVKRIKIVRCNAGGAQFANLTPGSVHEVITPPEGYTNNDGGLWVMGVGEPVKVLTREYEDA